MLPPAERFIDLEDPLGSSLRDPLLVAAVCSEPPWSWAVVIAVLPVECQGLSMSYVSLDAPYFA